MYDKRGRTSSRQSTKRGRCRIRPPPIRKSYIPQQSAHYYHIYPYIRTDFVASIVGTLTVASTGSKSIASRSTGGRVDQEQDARQTSNARGQLYRARNSTTLTD